MQRLLLLSSLFTIALYGDRLQDFLVQSGSIQGYEQLTKQQKKTFNDFWSNLESICTDSKEAFARLARDNKEGMDVLKQLFGTEDVCLSVSLSAERKQ